MKLLFWLCLALVLYTYLGYVRLALASSPSAPPAHASDESPADVSITTAARNEAVNLPAKLENLRRLEYPLQSSPDRHRLGWIERSDRRHPSRSHPTHTAGHP